MRLAWLTDIHLDHANRAAIESLGKEVAEARPDVVLLGGDIAEATSLSGYLEILSSMFQRTLYFVLGNHDFYRGSIPVVRTEAEQLAESYDGLIYLSSRDVIELSEHTALVGHDGWGDGGFGNPATTTVQLNDFFHIDELRLASARGGLLPELRRLGVEAGEHFRRVLPLALQSHKHVVALTHVPPFREAAWYEGRTADDEWLPFFACRAAGEAMIEVMQSHPDKRLTVLCGHTHSEGECRPLPNIEVFTGKAVYRQPRMQRIIEVE